MISSFTVDGLEEHPPYNVHVIVPSAKRSHEGYDSKDECVHTLEIQKPVCLLSHNLLYIFGSCKSLLVKFVRVCRQSLWKDWWMIYVTLNAEPWSK